MEKKEKEHSFFFKIHNQCGMNALFLSSFSSSSKKEAGRP